MHGNAIVTDGTTTKEVTTMTIGAANVTAFIGSGGPYWTDLDGDHQVSWSDAQGNTLTQAEAGSDGQQIGHVLANISKHLVARFLRSLGDPPHNR